MQKCEEFTKTEKHHPTTQEDARYKTLFEQVNAAAFLTSYQGEIIEANLKSCDLFGYQWNELLRLSLKDILSTTMPWDQLQEEIAAKGGIRFEIECITKDGSYIPTELSISLFTMNKNPALFVLVWDISQRKKAEEKLRESEKKYRGLFEYTTDATIVLDPRGDIIDANTKICQLLDMRKEQLTGKNLFNMDLLTHTSLPMVVKQFEQLLTEKTAKTFKTEIKNSQGTILTVEISSFFLVKKDNEVDNFVLIIRDITTKTINQNKHIFEHSLLKTMMNALTDCIYFKDIKNRYVLVNAAYAVQFNMKPEQMIGKTDFDFISEDQARKNFIDEKSIMHSKLPLIDKEEKIAETAGSYRYVCITKVPWYNEQGEVIGIMGITRDITKYKNPNITK